MLTPATQSVAISAPATVTMTHDPNFSGQDFGLSDGGGGGVFSPTTGNIPPDVHSANFTYTNATPGTYTITVTPQNSGGQPAQTVQVIVLAASPGSIDGFTLKPPSNSAPVNVPTQPYILQLVDSGGAAAVAGVGGQAFVLTTSGLSGSFGSSNTVTIPQGQSSVAFSYQAGSVGVAVLTATASGAPYSVNVHTAQAVISAPTGGGAGGRSMGPLIRAAGMEFGEAYLRGTLTTADDTPFAKLQSLDLKFATSVKEAMGPEQYSAVGVGIGDRKYTADFSVGTYSLQRFQLLLGGSAPSAQAAVTAASTAPTLAAAAGPTSFAAGYLAVGYAYRNKFGTTTISTLATQVLTSTQKVNVTSLGALPSGVTSVDWYVGSAVYATSALALAAPVYFHSNNDGSAFSITAFPTGTRVIPVASEIGAAGSVFAHYAYDQAPPFTVHCVNPADGSGRNLLIYGCVCTDIGDALKLRDWTTEKITCNVYGDNSVVPAKIFEWFAPTSGGFLV